MAYKNLSEHIQDVLDELKYWETPKPDSHAKAAESCREELADAARLLVENGFIGRMTR